MIDISKAEKYFKNNGYDDIIEESKPFLRLLYEYERLGQRDCLARRF